MRALRAPSAEHVRGVGLGDCSAKEAFCSLAPCQRRPGNGIGRVRICGRCPQPMRDEAQITLRSQSGRAVKLAAEADSLLLLLGGEPINWPVASHGPAVINRPGKFVKRWQPTGPGVWASYAERTPIFFRIVVIGHQFENAD